MQELCEFLNAGTTWRDLTTVDEFSEKCELTKSLFLLGEIAKQNGIYPEEYLNEKKKLIYQAIKQLFDISR